MAPSWHTINTAIWTLALLLQVALAFSVFRRNIVRSFPAFAVLTVFYPLRALLLFALPGHVAPEEYEQGLNILSIAEILLEAWILVDLTRIMLKRRSGQPARWAGLITATLVVAAISWSTWAAAPERVPVDRTQVFFWWATLALAAAAVFLRRSPPGTADRSANLLPICAGFAAFSLCQLIALAGRIHAFADRSRQAWVAWSYLPPIAYMAVVVYWLLFLRKEAKVHRAAVENLA